LSKAFFLDFQENILRGLLFDFIEKQKRFKCLIFMQFTEFYRNSCKY
jgi:hypothetical protein